MTAVRRRSLFCAVLVIVLAAYIVYQTTCGATIMRSLSSDALIDASLQDNYSEPTRILYLTQTEECLPDHLKSALGNSSACHCDVVVLSFKKACNDTSLPHVEYLFNSSTTWTTGRNLLFHSKIHDRSEGYLYFIMMDDDIQPYWAKTAKGRSTTNLNPWRSFEEFIMRVQPPVAALEPFETEMTKKLEHRMLNNCSTELEYIPVVQYDGAFNAFHYKAVEHLLPYWDQMESFSWYCSQVYLIVWTEIVFPEQVVLRTDLLARNTRHHRYPRFWERMHTYLPRMLKNITQRVPANCQKASVLQEWRTKGLPHGWTPSGSATYCLPPPRPNQTIVPFKNFIC